VYRFFYPRFGDRYLSSNANITLPSIGSVPVGARYRQFRTEQGRRVTSFGILLDFDLNADGTSVQHSRYMVKEPWFIQRMKEEADLFILGAWES
jgi:hypothetical protein